MSGLQSGCKGEGVERRAKRFFEMRRTGEHGFTLIEMMLALGMIGLLLPVLFTSMRQITVQSTTNSTRVQALVPLENAGRSLGRDIPLAQATTLAEGVTSTTLQLSWTDWSDDSQYDTYTADAATYKRKEVTYSLSGTDLRRQYRVCNDWNLTTSTCDVAWGSPTTTTMAYDLTSISFYRGTSANRYVFTIVATSYPRGTSWAGEERTFKLYGSLLSSEEPV